MIFNEWVMVKLEKVNKPELMVKIIIIHGEKVVY